jgi:hypothetical protein
MAESAEGGQRCHFLSVSVIPDNPGPAAQGVGADRVTCECLIRWDILIRQTEGGFDMTRLNWERLQQAFTVDLLMTPREDLFTWQCDGDTSEASVQAKERRFDMLPVTDGDRIVGVLEAGSTEVAPLTDQWLVSSDTGIPDLLALLAESERPGLLVFQRQDVVGLVTPADLNKMPARIYFYNVVGELELALADYIEEYFKEQLHDEVVSRLSKKRQREFKKNLAELDQGNADVDPVELLYLSDLIGIVEKTPKLYEGLGFPSRSKAKNTLGGLNQLRQRTMHLVRPLLRQIPDDLLKLHSRVERTKRVLDKLEEARRSTDS